MGVFAGIIASVFMKNPVKTKKGGLTNAASVQETNQNIVVVLKLLASTKITRLVRFIEIIK